MNDVGADTQVAVATRTPPPRDWSSPAVVAKISDRIGSKSHLRDILKQNLDGIASGSSKIHLHKASILAQDLSRPKPALIAYCRHERYCPSLPEQAERVARVDGLEGHLGIELSFGHHSIPFSSTEQWHILPSLSTLPKTEAHFPRENFAFTRSDVASSKDARGPARTTRAVTVTPPGGRHADGPSRIIRIRGLLGWTLRPCQCSTGLLLYWINKGSRRVSHHVRQRPSSRTASLGRPASAAELGGCTTA